MDDRTPPGERDVFNMLAAGPDDWVALHSLDLAPWNRGLRTEIDFLAIVPDSGLLCIEVKSHETITFDNGEWLPSDIRRSPFKQAADARYTFHRRLAELAPQFRRVPVIHCCIFPNASFDLAPNLSVQPWELLDRRQFRAFTKASAFCADLKTRILSSIQADMNLHPLDQRLSPSQVDSIVKTCIPVQRFRPDSREEIKKREEEMEQLLRAQQKPILQLATLNRRVIITGGAGTGKTLIAMEVARRAADKGLRVGLICFNRLIGDWMEKQIKSKTPAIPNLVVGRAIRILAKMADVEIPTNPSSNFWAEELLELIEEKLTDPDYVAAAAFDYLVVDEAQDLLAKPRLWHCLTRFLDGGVCDGSFCIFGDFENQVLGERENMSRSLRELLSSATPTSYALTENCRNYRIVGDSAVRLSGIGRSVYSGYMRAGGSIQNYDISFYDNDNDQRDQLARLLKAFKGQAYKPSDIVVLSFRSSDDCVAAQLASTGYNLRPAWQLNDNSPLYTSVHAFKGLEKKVVILTDVALTNADFQRDLFYTGMTRASESVRILCDRKSQDTLTEWLWKGSL